MANSSDHIGPSKIRLMDIPNVVGGGPWGQSSGSDAYQASNDATLFSSSLPVLLHEKLNMNDGETGFQAIDDASSSLYKVNQEVENNDSFEALGPHAIGSLLPDDEDDLLAGIMDDFDISRLSSRLDDLDESDIFGCGGGMELETDLSMLSLSDGVIGNDMASLNNPNCVGAVAGEHPYGEHPSRTLFVRNINSNVEDSELKMLFEQYGDIRTLYTACKHRGFVMISYYDIRAARTAMRTLQNKPLRRRKLDIHFSIPKDNPSDKDVNQGTLVVFNLDPSVSNDDLRQIFGTYGEVKEIRETPHKRHHKFIEFYDVRAADAALRALNRSDIAGKRIKLEPSRPGGTRRNMMLQLNQEQLELDETITFRNQMGSPLANSPPGNWMQFSSPVEHSPLHTFSKSPGFGSPSPNTSNHLPGLASILHHQTSNSVKIAPIGKDQSRNSHLEHMFSNTNLNHSAFQHSQSVPEPKLSNFSETLNGSTIETLSGPEFLWGSPSTSTHSEQAKPPTWSRPPIGSPFTSSGQANNGILHATHHGSYINSNLSYQNHHLHHHHHHIGSAPSNIPLHKHFGFFQESPEPSIRNSSFGGMGGGHNDRGFMVNMGTATMNTGINISKNMHLCVSPSFGMMSSPRLTPPMFLGSAPYPGLTATNMENYADRGRFRRAENSGNQMDSKKQFQLDLDKIINGEDTRTTLMIKNIPNKYTSKMLLASIDEYNRGTYDFLYLPIDFKNKCNVGYAFINMLSAEHIIQFYKAFNGKRWEKFNSEKVATLAYARIQGKAALVTHFQNSSLMNEDKRCRPIVFHSDGPEAGDQIGQEHPFSNSMNILVRTPNVSLSGDFPEIPIEVHREA